MIDKTSIRDFPPMTASLLADHSGVFRVGSEERRIDASDDGGARRQLVELMQAEAHGTGRPIRVTVTDPTGVTVLLVGADGALEEESQTPGAPDTVPPSAPPAGVRRVIQDPPPAPVPSRPAPVASSPASTPVAARPQPAAPVPPPAYDVQPFPPIAQQPATQQPATRQPATQQPGAQYPVVPQPAGRPMAPQQPAGDATTAPQSATPARRELRDAPSFLAPPTVGPAQQGVAGLLNRLGFSVAPSAAERRERDDVHAVSRHFPRRRTISVANQKGGANKTPTVVNLSSVFARYGGGGVAAWDNNETMGTLGWRTEQGGHDSTVLDLLAAAGDLLSPGAERADLSRFVHHQPGDKYEVLRSAADGEHVVTADEVDLVHRVLAKYYRLIVMDSGNSAGAPNWRRMVELTDQLVVPTTTVEDKKEGARLTLTAVSRVSERGAELARNAVVIVSEAEAKDTAIANAYAEDFRPYVRDVVVVPFDAALKNGVIRHDALRSSTRRAWLAAAAAVSQGL